LDHVGCIINVGEQKTVRKSALLSLLFLSASVLASGFLASPGYTQSWPSRAIRIVVPFPPGGTTDQIARWVQPLLQKDLNVPVVVENKGGASGSIGTQAVAASPPDGYTFLMVFDTHGVNPSLIPNIPFDTVKDLAPVMLVGKSPMVITAHNTAPYKTFADIVRASKEKPESVSFGTIGSGSLAHLAMTQIANQLNVKMNHVPYKGGGPLTVDAIAGHVPVAIASVALLSPHIKSGKLIPLAVTSPKRAEQLPDTPTIAEAAVPAYDAEAWWGLLAPARTPPTIIEGMREHMVKALNDPNVQKSLGEQGLTFTLSSAEVFGSFIEDEITKWRKVVKDNQIDAGQ
jgi:tripartite-type tricarboxylate transporter receptor subunit TctC